MQYSGPCGDRIDGFKSGEEVTTWMEDDAPALELNRMLKVGEYYLERAFIEAHPDLKQVKKEQEEGTNVIFYY